MAESTQRLSDYEKAQSRYQDLLSGSDRFKSLVEKQLGEKTNYNKDLIEQQQRLMEKQLSLPSQLRSEFSGGPIRNPLAQEAVIQQRASNVGSQLGSVSDLLAARGQRQSDMLSNALSTYQTRLAGEQTAAEAAWRLYQDALAREEAARARAAASSSNNWLAELFGGVDENGEGDGTGEDDVIIEVDDRPLGTKLIDAPISASLKLAQLASSNPLTKNIYSGIGNWGITQKLAGGIENTLKNFLSSSLGEKYKEKSKLNIFRR